jgi:hypothetical protein
MKVFHRYVLNYLTILILPSRENDLPSMEDKEEKDVDVPVPNYSKYSQQAAAYLREHPVPKPEASWVIKPTCDAARSAPANPGFTYRPPGFRPDNFPNRFPH